MSFIDRTKNLFKTLFLHRSRADTGSGSPGFLWYRIQTMNTDRSTLLLSFLGFWYNGWKSKLQDEIIMEHYTQSPISTRVIGVG